MSKNLIHSTTETFEKDVLKSELPVFVDFWAEWCGPCRMVGPIVEELSSEYDGKMRFVKLNTDENEQISIQYGVRGIPTLMIFKNGEPIERIVGAAPKEYYVRAITKTLQNR